MKAADAAGLHAHAEAAELAVPGETHRRWLGLSASTTRLVSFAATPHLLPRIKAPGEAAGKQSKSNSRNTQDTRGTYNQPEPREIPTCGNVRKSQEIESRNLAKVGVEGSNPFARSNFQS